MNNQRRNKLKEALSFLEKALNITVIAKEEEQNAVENVPENLQGSEKYENMENTVDSLEDAIEDIEQATQSITNIIS